MSFYALSALINFITSAVLGVLVIIKNRSAKNVAFFLFCAAVAFWSFFYLVWQLATDAESALLWSRVLMAGAIFIPAAYLHFVYALIGLLQKRRMDIILTYGVFGLFLLADFTPKFVSHVEPQAGFPYWPIAGPLYSLFLVIWFFYVIYSTILLFEKYRRTSGLLRLQIKYVIFGMLVGFIGGSTNYFLWYRVPVLPIANIFVSIYVGSMAYAIARYRLMDIRMMARGAIIYFGLAVFSYGVFYSLIWFYETVFGGVFTKQALIFGVLLAPLFVAIFYLFDKIIRQFANRYLFTSLYDYQETITHLTNELTNYIDLNKIVTLIVDTIMQKMQLDRAGILLLDTKQKQAKYRVAKVIGFNKSNGFSLVQDSFLIQYLLKTKKPLIIDELQAHLAENKFSEDRAAFLKLSEHLESIEAEICLPLITGGKLIGIIILGNKNSRDPYTNEDLNLLDTLSKQASIAIDNAEQHKQVQDFKKNLEIKVEEQTRDLLETNQELIKKNELTKKLLEIKSDFLRVVNHQLNTPISIMRGYFSMMREGNYSVTEVIPAMEYSLDRISQTVDDFWDAYELEGEEILMNPEKVDLVKLVTKIVQEKEKHKLVQNRNLALKVVTPDFVPPLVWCDPKKIFHVVANLVDNAIYYTAAGSVKISFILEKKFLRINVTDTGSGILKKDSERLFEKFSRGSAAQKLHPDGSGLGLYIVKKIVEGNGGQINFTSAGAGKGTTFYFTVPLYLGQEDKQPSSSRSKIEIF